LISAGPRKSVSKAPTADDKINGLASTLSDYEAKIQGKKPRPCSASG